MLLLFGPRRPRRSPGCSRHERPRPSRWRRRGWLCRQRVPASHDHHRRGLVADLGLRVVRATHCDVRHSAAGPGYLHAIAGHLRRYRVHHVGRHVRTEQVLHSHFQPREAPTHTTAWFTPTTAEPSMLLSRVPRRSIPSNRPMPVGRPSSPLRSMTQGDCGRGTESASRGKDAPGRFH